MLALTERLTSSPETLNCQNPLQEDKDTLTTGGHKQSCHSNSGNTHPPGMPGKKELRGSLIFRELSSW